MRVLCLLCLVAATAWSLPPARAEQPPRTLQALRPATAEAARDLPAEAWAEAAAQLDQWVATQAWNVPAAPADVLPWLEQLVDAKVRHDRLVEDLLTLRGQFAAMAETAGPRPAVRNYLKLLSTAVDLGGRLRYTLRDAIDNATYALDPSPELFQGMIRLLTERRIGIGASALAYVLFDPPAGSNATPFPDATKRLVIELMQVSDDRALVPVLALYLGEPDQPPTLRLAAARALVELGLPQEPLPNTPVEARPPFTPSQFHETLVRIDTAPLSTTERAQLRELIAWSDANRQRGCLEPEMRLGDLTVRPGDWLLMRNPSPYNRFTDLAPGLFTHVGAVAEVRDPEGRRHLVIVDLPERGTRIPATNVEMYLERSLHYMFVRHPDPQVAQAMAQAARDLIGNESQFDLAFQTERIADLKGQSLAGRRIHTYCAGLLLLLVQAAERPRAEFFPFEESAASPRSLQNLSVLGLNLGQRFVSPTGPLFAAGLDIVGRREPMYDPGREVKERVYDHFAAELARKPLILAPDLLQSMRLETARLAESHPWLGQALARLNDVSPDMDLVAAAKAASVIEGLDQIADRGWQRFEAARAAVLASPEELHELSLADPKQHQQRLEFRRVHAQLVADWSAQRLTPRDLRVALVRFYADQSCRELEARFFTPRSDSP